MLYSWKLYLPTGIGVFGVGELLPGELGSFMQFGALGILGFAVWRLLDELKEARKERMELEKMRHDDHNDLQNTLRSMTANCASVNAKREEE